MQKQLRSFNGNSYLCLRDLLNSVYGVQLKMTHQNLI